MHLAWVAATGAFSVGGYPTSEVSGRSREDPMPEKRRPRGVSYPTSEVRGSSRKCQAVTVQVRWRGATPHPRSGAAAERSYPLPKARGCSPEDLPHAQGQGPWPEGATLPPSSRGCVGAGGPTGVIQRSRSEGAAVRR